MLPARYRMTRSAEFGATVRHGVRAAQPDLVVHAYKDPEHPDGPRIGFVVSKAVGCAVERHRVTRRLRHIARGVIADLDPADRVVVRALPSSSSAPFARLERELVEGVWRTRVAMDRRQ